MKKKALLGMMLLLVVALLVGCGGVAQDEYDAVVAERDAAKTQVTSLQSQLSTAQSSLTAANTAKTTAETNLTTAQAELTKAKSDLATAQSQLSTANAEISSLKAKVAELEAKVAELESEAEEPTEEPTTPPAGGFTGTKYSNTEFGFSFQYPTAWADRPSLPDFYIKFFGGAPYYVPGIYAVKLDQSVATDLEGALKKYLELLDGYTFKSMTGTTSVTIDGQACTKADIVYTGAYGDLDGTMVGFTKNNKWVLIGVIQYTAIGATFESATQKDDIIGSITFP